MNKVQSFFRERRTLTLVISGILIVLILLLWAVYLRFVKGYAWADWTGFREFTAPDKTYYRSKTLWDFLELLIVPIALGIGAIWFNRQEKEREQRFAKDKQQEEALQNYLDKITELLLKNDLLSKKNTDDPVVDVAQTRTITTLRTLDLARKNIILQFLRDSKLDSFLLTSASLSHADLYECDLSDLNLTGANLYWADLTWVNLLGANLSGANLRMAILRWAYLGGVNLAGANLGGADLSGAALTGANLSGADLSGADLTGAYLSGADLTGADLTRSNLRGVTLRKADLSGARGLTEDQIKLIKSLEGATMPDGSIHG